MGKLTIMGKIKIKKEIKILLVVVVLAIIILIRIPQPFTSACLNKDSTVYPEYDEGESIGIDISCFFLHIIPCPDGMFDGFSIFKYIDDTWKHCYGTPIPLGITTWKFHIDYDYSFTWDQYGSIDSEFPHPMGPGTYKAVVSVCGMTHILYFRILGEYPS